MSARMNASGIQSAYLRFGAVSARSLRKRGRSTRKRMMSACPRLHVDRERAWTETALVDRHLALVEQSDEVLDAAALSASGLDQRSPREQTIGEVHLPRA